MQRGFVRWRWASGALVFVLLGAVAPPLDHARYAGAGSARCLSCHRIERALSHPVDVVPSMDVPARFPLEGGRLTCVTCHDVSGARPRLRDDGSCVACHDQRTGRVSEIHALATGRAHLAWGQASEASDAAWSAAPDPETGRCMSCHDGALASRGNVRIGHLRGSAAGQYRAGEHPIGVEQGPRGFGDTLRHPSQIDPSIRLFDGMVGCGSCHSPYAQKDMMLVMDNHGSTLCLECHDF